MLETYSLSLLQGYESGEDSGLKESRDTDHSLFVHVKERESEKATKYFRMQFHLDNLEVSIKGKKKELY